MGTITYPKHLSDISTVKIGDVVEVNGQLYMSRYAGSASVSSDVTNSTQWLKLNYGSFLYPKVAKDGIALSQNDIIFDSATSLYYIYKGDRNITLGGVSSGQWLSLQNITKFNYKSDWMKLLRPFIGSRRYGDLVIPGSHDSGTWAVDKTSTLVEYRPLFMQAFTALHGEFITNISRAQRLTFGPQLLAGFRNLDIRIADVNNTFYWWHYVKGNEEITNGLQEIRNFSLQHEQEILILYFQHITAPGNATQPRTPMSESRKRQLSDILLQHLGDRMINRSGLSENPSVDEMLNKGGNIIAQMQDDYIRATNSDLFWPVVVISQWVGQTNTENLFLDRSRLLKLYKNNASLSAAITDVSGCVSPDVINIIGSAALYSEMVPQARSTIETFLPDLKGLSSSKMSFEGLLPDLLSVGVTTNTVGMRKRPPMNYTNGASVHYGGVNDMLPHWLARPQLYKVNIIYVDDIESSTIVDTAIKANLGQIPRQVTIAFQGNARDGYLKWNGYQTTGGADGLSCSSVLARYQVTSATYSLPGEDSWTNLASKNTISFSEGQYPADARVILQVSIDNQNWVNIFEDNIQSMITTTRDIYLRGSNQGNGTGFAYLSERYNVFGESCTAYPQNSTDYFILKTLSTTGSNSSSCSINGNNLVFALLVLFCLITIPTISF